MSSISRTALLIAAGVILTAALYVLCTPPQQGDPGFDTRVDKPSYATKHPRVYFDEGHWTQSLYQPFIDLIQNDGYFVARQKKSLTREALTGFDVLVLTIVMGFKEGAKTLPGLRHNLKGDAFTPEESTVVKSWVDAGGSLLLASDYAPTAKSADKMAREFGLTFLDGWAVEPESHDLQTGRLGFIVFSRANKQLAEHAVTHGIDRVMSFTGQAMLFPAGATPFLKLSPEARVAPYRENEAKTEPVPAAGAAQGVALESGQGRVIALGETIMLTSVLIRANGSTQHLGMGKANYDDRQLTLNIMHWLSRL